MKFNWNEKYNTISAYAFLVAAAIIVFYLAMSQIDIFTDKISGIITILNPFIIGFSIAYLLNFVLKFFENKAFKTKALKKIMPKSTRGIGILFTYVTALLVLYLFSQFVLPQVIDSILGLVNDIPTYITNLTRLVETIIYDLNIEPEYLNVINSNIQELLNYIVKFTTNLIPVLGGLVSTILSSVWNIILGIIISIYLLIDKERLCALLKKITYSIFSKEYSGRIIELSHRSNDTFGKFLSGKILDSGIIGALTFFILTIFKMPYVILISVIIGITNIIPFFGPFIGAIPSFVIILFISPVKALWFLLIVLVIQQIDGNIIGPKILGDSIGISAFWILFSILVAGKLLGLVGMILGVPLFAVIYSIIKENVERRLRSKGLKTDTKDYM